MTTAMTTESSLSITEPSPRRTLRQRLSGIRVRIVFGYVVLLAAALTVAIVSTRQYVLDRVDDDIDEKLSQEIDELRLLAQGSDPDTGRPFGTDVGAIFDTFLDRNVPELDESYYTFVNGTGYQTSYNADLRLLEDTALVNDWTSSTGPRRATYKTAAGEVRGLAVPVGGADAGAPKGVFVVTYEPTNDRSDALGAVRVITIAGIIVLALSAVVAWSLADRVLRPVRSLTDTARRISHSDLSARIPVDGHDELAELGETFNAMLERLDRSFDYQRRFLDDVAHELRTPITIARGHIDVLGDTPQERDEAVAIVSDELDRMSRYVSDLLMLAKSERPDFLRLGRVDLGDLAATIHQRVGALGDRRWTLDTAPQAGVVKVRADQERLVQAAVNLASNAVQHTSDGDEIGIGVGTNGDTYELWVRDTGPGIEPDVLDTLFTRYTRGASSRVSRPDGTGIGLSIVDAIARAHGGSVSASSRPGVGATIVIRCPVVPE